MTDEAVFKVRTPDGHEYSIFADGSTEGFPSGSMLFNRIPALVAQAGDMAVAELMQGVTANPFAPAEDWMNKAVTDSKERHDGLTIDA